jgi:hypothetical protein
MLSIFFSPDIDGKAKRNDSEKHLELALRAKCQGQFTFQTLPIEQALEEWYRAAEGRGT